MAYNWNLLNLSR